MAQDDKDLEMKAISELRGFTFVIPSQQRGYKWTKNNIVELVSDFSDFIKSKKPMYCLQPLAVVKRDEKRYEVLDGQQRLTTIYLLYKYLFGESPYTFEYARDSKDDLAEDVANRCEFLQNIDKKTQTEADQYIDYYFIWQAYSEIKNLFENESKDDNTPKFNADDFKKLLNATATSAQSVKVIWYEVASSKSHETFRNLNSGKMPLSNTELIKALFLNRDSGLPSSYLSDAAALFEQMELELREDRFWYMFNTEEIRAGQSRMDAIFNIVAECRKADYDIDPRWSFRNYFDHGKGGCSLEEKWTKVRHTYLRIRDLYEDIYTYHYIGFLSYSGAHGCGIRDLLKEMRQKSKSGFKEWLWEKIAGILRQGADSLEGYYYAGDNTLHLRRLFVMYNIETILTRYDQLCKQRGLQYDFERFPFELLNTQNWDIEHIAPQTDASFKSIAQCQEWLNSTKADLGAKYAAIECEAEEELFLEKQSEVSFRTLYNKIVRHLDEEYRDTIPEEVEDISEDGQYKNKNQLGNLTLLDRHTNISYHNALFPTKRRFVITVDGLRTCQDSTDVYYVPPTTRQVFTKAYVRGDNVVLSHWGQKDADAYFADIKLKLQKYFQV